MGKVAEMAWKRYAAKGIIEHIRTAQIEMGGEVLGELFLV